jgi:hypothetical protein
MTVAIIVYTTRGDEEEDEDEDEVVGVVLPSRWSNTSSNVKDGDDTRRLEWRQNGWLWS